MMEPLHPSETESRADKSMPPVPPAPEPEPEGLATPAPSPSAPARLALLQEAFLLEQVATQGTGGMTGGELNRKIGAAVRRELQLSPDVAGKVRGRLSEQGYLATRKNGRKILF